MELNKINRGSLLENLRKIDYLEKTGVEENMILKVFRLDGFQWTGPRTRTICVLLSVGFYEVTILSRFINKIPVSLERILIYGVNQIQLFPYLSEVENSRRLLSFWIILTRSLPNNTILLEILHRKFHRLEGTYIYCMTGNLGLVTSL